jgi:hypothetical protein
MRGLQHCSRLAMRDVTLACLQAVQMRVSAVFAKATATQAETRLQLRGGVANFVA